MSVNNVLNRPMFRQVALRKGYIKPKKAKVGQFIRGSGFSMNPIATQNVSNFNPRNVPMVIEQPGMFSRTGQFFKRLGSDIKNFPSTAKQQLMQPRTKVPFGLGGGIGGLLGAEGLYQASSGLTTKLGMQPGTAKTIVDLGLTTAGMFNPYTRALGLGITGLRAARGILGGATDYVTGQPMGTTSQKFQVDLGNPLFTNVFTPVDPTKPRETRKERRDRKKLEALARAEGSEGQISTTPPLNVAKAEGEQNVKGTDSINVANIKSAAVEKATGVPDITMRGDPEANLDMQMKPKVPKPEAPVKETTEDKQTDTVGLADVNENSPFAQQIALARKIRDELSAGRDPGLARRTFLLNLAAGLMSGTTKRQGLAGAVDVFGQALGPAVNNAVTVRLKEDELDNKLMGQALEFSSDFLKAQNESYVLPETKEVGVIQYINKNGKIVNVAGRMLKDGTKQIQIPGALNPNGTSVFQTASAGTTFIAHKDKNKETLDAAGDLGGKYAALNLINRSLGIIEKGDAKVGVVGAVGLYSGRIQDAIGDILTFRNQTKTEGEKSFNAEQTKAAARLVREGEFDNVEDAKNYLTKEFGTFNKIYNNNLRSIKNKLEGGSKLDYERLAINETVLVYRLANSLKSKDRLTQKDIQMAKELVKVFPFFRGDESVTAALVAVGETILDDIKQQETVYLKAGGTSEYLLRERQQYNLISPGATFDDLNGLDTTFQERKKSLKDLSQEELLNKLRIS